MAPNDTNENEFWMVWIDGRSGPTMEHPNYGEAQVEAERLLRKPENRGRKAYILEVVSYGMVESPPVTWRTV